MPAETSRAVFLSYASQDAAAARSICDALRATGAEVWFDQNELRGGDAWDAKIRKQIKECALFVPIISANTQARPEGYFRLEWKLAVDRSHLMADDQPFLLPVIIDDTPEPAARVPDRFRDVQWTRLVLTETPAAFAQRAQALLRGGADAAPADARRTADVERKKSKSDSVLWGKVVPVAGMLVGLVFAWRGNWFTRPARPQRAEPAAVPAVEKPSAAVAKPTTPAAAPLSETRQLIAKARALFEPLDGATRQDFLLAEELLKRAVTLDPSDGEAWAAQAQLLCAQIGLGHDRSPVRIEAARSAAERAIRLAPESRQARFAQAGVFRFQGATRSDAERALQKLVEEGPDDRLILRTYASMLRERGKFDEALSLFDRAAALPGGDAAALYGKFVVLSMAQRHDEAEAVLDAAIAAQPAPYLLRAKVSTLTLVHGDLDGAAQTLAKVPGTYLVEDTGAYAASLLWLWRREPEKALGVWRAFTRDLIECAEFRGPKAFLVGQAQRMAGRTAAAEAEWKAALALTERELAAQPSAVHWVYWRTRLLGSLGRRGEAAAGLRTFEELIGAKGLSHDAIPIYLLLDRTEEVIAALEKSHTTLAANPNPTVAKALRNNLRFNHEWDRLREEPRFKALLAQLDTARAPEAVPAKK